MKHASPGAAVDVAVAAAPLARAALSFGAALSVGVALSAGVATLSACGARSTPQPTDVEIDARAKAAVDAFWNGSPILTSDNHVIFESNRDGLPQLYVGDVAHPDAPPMRLPTPSKERAIDPWLMPDGKTLLFMSDVSSDQKLHIWRIGMDGSGLADLTPGNDQMRQSLHVARTSGLIVYASHTMADQTTHIYAQPIDGPPREIYRDAAVGSITDISADGTRIIFNRAISDTELIAFVIDTTTGAATRLYPREGDKVAIGDAAFTADGAHVIVASEEPGRPPQLLRLDATTGAEKARYDEPTAKTASIASINPSPAGDRIAVFLDAGDHSELRMLDARELRPVGAPPIPLGSLEAGRFTADGSRLTVAVHDASGPSDIAALDLAASTITPLRKETRPGLAAPPRASIEHLRAFDGKTLPVNLYLPSSTAGATGPAATGATGPAATGATGPAAAGTTGPSGAGAAATSSGAGGRHPTLVLVHGGPSGSAKLGWSPTIAFWTAMGFVVVAPNIRGSTGFGIDYQRADDREHRADAVRDMETVNQWARAQPWCDGDRIIIGGISYGGYMTLLALTRQPSLWRAGIDGSGMSNLKTMEQLEDQTIRAYDDTEFGALGKDDALLAEWSPITAVDKISSPVFVYQGVRDPVTPQKEADQIVEALHARNIPVEYMLVDNEGHGVTRRENQIAYFVRSYRFVAMHLKLR